MDEDFLAVAPRPALRGLVSGPIVAFDLRVDPRAVHFGVPSPSVSLIVSFDGPLDVGWAADPAQSTRYPALLAGLHTRPALVHTHGRQCGIQLALTPSGIRRLTAAPAAELAEHVRDAGELVPAPVHEQMAAAETWAGRIDILQQHLVRRATGSNWVPDPGMRHAWTLLQAPGARVGTVAAQVGWSRRQLVNRFRAEVGIPPKQVAVLARLDRSRALARQGLGLAEVAHRTGYSDQAHLARDWHALAGRTPREVLAEDFPILQDLASP